MLYMKTRVTFRLPSDLADDLRELPNQTQFVEAALREVEEETGLCELNMVTQLPTIDWYFRDRGKLVHKFCHFFLLQCEGVRDAVPQLDEGITECIWQPPEIAIETVSYANAREVMRAAAAWLRDATALDLGTPIGDPVR